MSFPRYPKYKDSGVEWLGEVPEHWNVRSLRHSLSNIFNGISCDQIDESPDTVPVTRIETISSGTIDGSRVGHIPRQMARSDMRLRCGDILFSNINSLNMIGNCALYSGGSELYAGMNLLVLRPSGVNSGWLYWVIRAGMFRQIVESLAKPAINQASISQASLNAVQIATPYLGEQKAIASFLDQETSKIDALVKEQRRLIELLKEKRQAVISHAVTKGLDPSSPMKDSGSAWLGQVPARWNVGMLTRVATRIVVGIAEAATHAYVDLGVPILRSTNIRAGRIIGDILNIDPTFAEERGSKLINGGDLVTVRTGNAGVTAVVPAELDGCQCFTMLITSLSSRASSGYYCYFLNSEQARSYFAVEGWGTAQVNISVPILKYIPISIPDMQEQLAIVNYLDFELRRLDEMTLEAGRAIELLQERRSAIISAAVTGKIDVRDLGAKEPA